MKYFLSAVMYVDNFQFISHSFATSCVFNSIKLQPACREDFFFSGFLCKQLVKISDSTSYSVFSSHIHITPCLLEVKMNNLQIERRFVGLNKSYCTDQQNFG